ncbi:MAG: SPFH domain-containing protein [Actinomycetaceae bacterium]
MSEATVTRSMSSIKESLASWSDVAQLLRGGDRGSLVPVVIPKDQRGLRWMFFAGIGIWLVTGGILTAIDGHGARAMWLWVAGALVVALAVVWWWRSSIIEIEEGTVGVRSRFGAITSAPLSPGRHYLWHPWTRVDYVVDVSTEIPYTAPVLACPTAESVPLRSIEFFLKFRIHDAIQFVRTIGAGNFDLVLSNAVQDAIRQRSRLVRTEEAHDLRGSDVADMQALLNRQLARYGVQIMGCNIPDVRLPEQYQQHIATRERVSKELQAYEKEWDLTRKRRIDTLLMDIERSKKVRDAKVVEVNASLNEARKNVAQMLEEQETEAQKVKWQIETKGRTNLVAAQGEARAQEQLATSYRDNRAVLGYELARRRLEVGSELTAHAPRPVIVHTDGTGADTSALSTLLLAQLLPGTGPERQGRRPRTEDSRPSSQAFDADRIGAMADAAQDLASRRNDDLRPEDVPAPPVRADDDQGRGRPGRRR